MSHSTVELPRSRFGRVRYLLDMVVRGRGVVLFSALALACGVAVSQAAEVRFHGLLDVVTTERDPGYAQNQLTRGDNPFDPVGLRLFAESTVNPRVEVFAQTVIHDATGLYLDGAYVMFTPDPKRDLHLLAGKLPWAVGTWGPRTYSNKNPLIGIPLIYSHHTSLSWGDIPPTADALLAAANTGQYGVGYYGTPLGPGMPIVDDSYWDVGVSLTGSQRPFEYALGINAGAPGWASITQDDNTGRTVLGRIGVAPMPGLRAGVSGAYGPYLGAWLNPALANGKTVNDYKQKLAMADVEWEMGHVELHAEGARNFWQTPTVGTVSVTGGYVEAKFTTSMGGFVAGRYDQLVFGEITSSTGERRPWDDGVKRWEAAVGYRFSRDTTGKLDYQRTELDHGADDTYPIADLLSAQLSVGF